MVVVVFVGSGLESLWFLDGGGGDGDYSSGGGDPGG